MAQVGVRGGVGRPAGRRAVTRAPHAVAVCARVREDDDSTPTIWAAVSRAVVWSSGVMWVFRPCGRGEWSGLDSATDPF